MRRVMMIASAVTFAGAILAGAAEAADVHVGVHIGVPAPPPIVFQAAPRLVVVPGAPRVYYAPDVSVNFFSYGGRYYTYDDGNWFVARDYGGPWSYVAPRYVPHAIVVVPHRYYHVPPRVVGGGHWDHGHGHYQHGSYHHGGNAHAKHGGGNGHAKHGNDHHGNGHGKGHDKHH